MPTAAAFPAALSPATAANRGPLALRLRIRPPGWTYLDQRLQGIRRADAAKRPAILGQQFLVFLILKTQDQRHRQRRRLASPDGLRHDQPKIPIRVAQRPPQGIDGGRRPDARQGLGRPPAYPRLVVAQGLGKRRDTRIQLELPDQLRHVAHDEPFVVLHQVEDLGDALGELPQRVEVGTPFGEGVGLPQVMQQHLGAVRPAALEHDERRIPVARVKRHLHELGQHLVGEQSSQHDAEAAARTPLLQLVFEAHEVRHRVDRFLDAILLQHLQHLIGDRAREIERVRAPIPVVQPLDGRGQGRRRAGRRRFGRLTGGRQDRSDLERLRGTDGPASRRQLVLTRRQHADAGGL